jgi:hypothetical protein
LAALQSPGELASDPSPALLSANQIARATAYLDDSQWDFKPAPDRWSIAEILEHVVIVESRVHLLIGRIKDAPPAKAGRNDSQIDEFVIFSDCGMATNGSWPRPATRPGTPNKSGK